MQQRTIDINPDKIKSENIIFPAIAEAKKTKSGYIMLMNCLWEENLIKPEKK
jgi:hypothetical protein